MKKIKQNLFWALIYNSAGIPIAAMGLLSPMVAAAAMALSSISVIANSSLLKRLKIKDDEISTVAEERSKQEMTASVEFHVYPTESDIKFISFQYLYCKYYTNAIICQN